MMAAIYSFECDWLGCPWGWPRPYGARRYFWRVASRELKLATMLEF